MSIYSSVRKYGRWWSGLLIWPTMALAQISPGPLSRAHQSLNGPLHCGSCHKLGTGENQFKCLDCHTGIADRLARRRGFHAAVMKPGASSRDCISCHSDHNGLNFPLVRWEPSEQAFDHRKTGYVLEGKHAALTCKQCHNPSNIPPAEIGIIKVEDPNRTFLGLSRDCHSCHEDAHGGRLGRDCAQCHNSVDWKAAATGFNHSKTRYLLTGAHAQVACQKCHRTDPANPKVTQYTGIPFAKCSDCHSDPHHGEFKANCESCHTTAGWRQASETKASVNFDHSRTKFPLVGKHQGVKCDACHAGGDFNKPLAHTRCMDCHRDVHGGQFLARKDHGECASCHTEEGFKPAKFGIKEHASTAYPLEGRHTTVECAKCHIPAGEKTLYKVKFARCTDCHRDIHLGQFASAPNNNRCESCHTLKGFKPSTFTLARHSTTLFQLTGSHLAVACLDCHRVPDGSAPNSAVPYHFKTLACTECHTDPHHGEFRARMEKPGPTGQPVGCEACHNLKAWSDTARFDHSTTRFTLTGTHRAVACADCHKPPNLEVTMKNVAFNSAPLNCEGCHQDPHAGQFARSRRNPGCVDCHNTNKWRPSTFDHERDAGFHLKGAHEQVKCVDCHKTTRMVAEKPVLFFKPTPKECSACHGPAVPRPTG